MEWGWGGARYSAPSRTALGPTQPPIRWEPGHLRGVNRPGCGDDHPPPSSADVKERMQLYLYSPYWPYGLYRASVPVQYSYTSTPPIGRTACTEPQCLYSTAIHLLPLWAIRPVQSLSACTVDLYLYPPYWPYDLYRASAPVQGCTLHFLLYNFTGTTDVTLRIQPTNKAIQNSVLHEVLNREVHFQILDFWTIGDLYLNPSNRHVSHDVRKACTNKEVLVEGRAVDQSADLARRLLSGVSP